MNVTNSSTDSNNFDFRSLEYFVWAAKILLPWLSLTLISQASGLSSIEAFITCMSPENSTVPSLPTIGTFVLLPRIYTDGSGRLDDVSMTAHLYAHEIESMPIDVGSGQRVTPFNFNRQNETTPYPWKSLGFSQPTGMRDSK